MYVDGDINCNFLLSQPEISFREVWDPVLNEAGSTIGPERSAALSSAQELDKQPFLSNSHLSSA